MVGKGGDPSACSSLDEADQAPAPVLTFTPAPTVLCLTERVRVGSLKLGQTTSVVVQMVGLVVGMVAERLEVVGRSTSGAELHAFQASCLVYVRIVDPLLTGAMESTGTPAPP